MQTQQSCSAYRASTRTGGRKFQSCLWKRESRSSRGSFRPQASQAPGPKCLYQGFSQHNQVVTVLEIPEDSPGGAQQLLAGSRVLLLDTTGNLHSIYHPERVLTGCYWDLLATLPSLVPPGPLGLMGLGAGTVPRIIGEHYPCGPSDDGASNYLVHGWELDPGVVMASRLYLGMERLEQCGQLVVHTGDALSPSACVPGGFSGIIVDLFAEGRLLPQMTQRATWEEFRSRLAPHAGSRLIVNLGQLPLGEAAHPARVAYEALEAAFDGEVSVMTQAENTLVLTGPLPGPEEWPGLLPERLRHLGDQQRWARAGSLAAPKSEPVSSLVTE